MSAAETSSLVSSSDESLRVISDATVAATKPNWVRELEHASPDDNDDDTESSSGSAVASPAEGTTPSQTSNASSPRSHAVPTDPTEAGANEPEDATGTAPPTATAAKASSKSRRKSRRRGSRKRVRKQAINRGTIKTPPSSPVPRSSVARRRRKGHRHGVRTMPARSFTAAKSAHLAATLVADAADTSANDANADADDDGSTPLAEPRANKPGLRRGCSADNISLPAADPTHAIKTAVSLWSGDEVEQEHIDALQPTGARRIRTKTAVQAWLSGSPSPHRRAKAEAGSEAGVEDRRQGILDTLSHWAGPSINQLTPDDSSGNVSEASTSQEAFLFSELELPDKLTLYILAFLGVRSLGRLDVTSRYFQDLAENERLWKSLTLQRFRDVPQASRSMQMTWKQTYERLLHDDESHGVTSVAVSEAVSEDPTHETGDEATALDDAGACELDAEVAVEGSSHSQEGTTSAQAAAAVAAASPVTTTKKAKKKSHAADAPVVHAEMDDDHTTDYLAAVASIVAISDVADVDGADDEDDKAKSGADSDDSDSNDVVDLDIDLGDAAESPSKGGSDVCGGRDRNSLTSDFEANIKAAVTEFRDTFVKEETFLEGLRTLLTYARRYPRIRMVNPKLAALGTPGVMVLRAVGMVESQGYLMTPVASADNTVPQGAEVLELLLAEAETGMAPVKPIIPLNTIMQARHGAQVGRCERFRVGVSETIGRRETMEDEVYIGPDGLFGVFDGHGGRNASMLASLLVQPLWDAALSESSGDAEAAFPVLFDRLHQQIGVCRIQSGTTAVVAWVDADMALHLGHVGDSRAVLCSPVPGNNGAVAYKARRLTQDHKPNRSDERKRIKSAGGKVTHRLFSRVYRVNGVLSISRALGDHSLQGTGLIAAPEIGEPCPLQAEDVLIIACDGVWDVLSDKKAGAIVMAMLSRGHDVQAAADKLRETAYDKGSDDNITVVVVSFQAP